MDISFVITEINREQELGYSLFDGDCLSECKEDIWPWRVGKSSPEEETLEPESGG